MPTYLGLAQGEEPAGRPREARQAWTETQVLTRGDAPPHTHTHTHLLAAETGASILALINTILDEVYASTWSHMDAPHTHTPHFSQGSPDYVIAASFPKMECCVGAVPSWAELSWAERRGEDV